MQEVSAIDRAASPVMALLSSPIGAPVRAVARIRASVHVKLLAGFLLITLLFIAITAVGLRTLTETTRQTNLLDQAHVRVGWSRQIEHALAMQMHFTSMALLAQSEDSVGLILKENNRFNDTLARLETAAPPEERTLIQSIRGAQDDAMATVADIANAVRDRRMADAMTALRTRQEPIYQSSGRSAPAACVAPSSRPPSAGHGRRWRCRQRWPSRRPAPREWTGSACAPRAARRSRAARACR